MDSSSIKPKKEIYLIRHGQTDLNMLGIVQGRGMNTDLNETGLAQAQAFFNAYKSVQFDKVYTSTLKRTHQTVQQFIDLGIETEALEGLDELCWGVWEGKRSTIESRAIFRDLAILWENGNYAAKTDGGESPEEVLARQLIALEHILGKEKEELILICMHGRAMRLLLCHLTNQPLSNMKDFPHNNTSLYKLQYDGNNFEITDFNNLNHLE